MLGLTRPRCSWQWAAVGKHPSAKDYISIGQEFPLAAGFSEWLDKGYRGQVRLRQSIRELCSWRFWARGAAPDEIVCGLVKDSCDSIGRPYPLLIMGSGALAGWDRYWELVPRAGESLWVQMEKISAQAFGSVANLEQALAALRSDPADWSSLPADDTDGEQAGDEFMSPADYDQFCRQIRKLSEKETGYIILDPLNEWDRAKEIDFIGSILKQSNPSAPNMVFIGGTSDMSCYAFFRRPLNGSDFTTLWTDLPQRYRVEEL